MASCADSMQILVVSSTLRGQTIWRQHLIAAFFSLYAVESGVGGDSVLCGGIRSTCDVSLLIIPCVRTGVTSVSHPSSPPHQHIQICYYSHPLCNVSSKAERLPALRGIFIFNPIDVIVMRTYPCSQYNDSFEYFPLWQFFSASKLDLASRHATRYLDSKTKGI